MIPQDAVIAANRFGFGANPDAMSAIASKTRKRWVKRRSRRKSAARAACRASVDAGRPDGVFPLVRDYRKELTASPTTTE